MILQCIRRGVLAVLIISCVLGWSGAVYAAAGDIVTVAGGGPADGSVATDVAVRPDKIFVDIFGNAYIADRTNQRIWKVDSSGNISTVAGNGSAGYSGDGGAATSAQLWNPTGVSVDGSGNLYIADESNQRIRKVDSTGNISTFAGNGSAGYSGDGSAATSALLNRPSGVSVDGSGNLYIADTYNHRIRKVDSMGNISTVAGTGAVGYSGDGGAATSALLGYPSGVSVDGSGNLYIADTNNSAIRMVDSTGNISTVVGNGSAGYSGDGGAATSALLRYPSGVSVDGSGNLYIADTSNQRIRKVDSTGNISTVAGSGAFGDSDGGGVATAASFVYPSDVFVDVSGNIYIADRGNNRILKVDDSGTISTVAGTPGSGYSGDGGAATNAKLNQPYGVSVDGSGNIYIADTSNQRVRKIVATAQATVVDIVAPDLTALYNESLIVPISITDASGLVSAELFVEYDTALATLDSVSSLGTVTQGWSASSNTEAGIGSLETVKVALATNVSSATGAATLIHLHFTLNDVRTPLVSPLTITHALLNDGTPAHTATDGSITLVGNDALATLSVTSVIPRDPVIFTIIDVDEDLDGAGGTDQMIATVSNGLQSETLMLNETATPGEFSGAIGTVFSASSTAAAHSGDGIVQAAAGDQIVFSAVDQLLSDGSGPSAIIGLVDVIGGADGVVAATLVTQPGDPVYIQVMDADLNVNFSGAETASVTVTNSRTAQSVSVLLTEVDVDDEVFFGSLATVPGAGTATEMGSAEDDVLTVTYDDVLTLVGSQVDRTAPNDVIDPWGDADDNESLQAFDAARVLLYLLNPGANPIDVQASNVDITPVTSGILAFDAALILQKRVGLISSFPVQDPASNNHPQGTAASAKVTPLLPSLSLVAGDGYVSLVADQRDEIVSGDVLLEGVGGRVVMGDEYGDFLTAHKATDEGTRIVFAGAESVRGSGELLRVYGVGPQGARLVWAAFNNTVESAATTDMVVVVPQAYTLLANAPNPFNPSTSIGFTLPEASAVKLVVFDALGQTVRTLVDERRSAGRYTATWNGRNAGGSQVSSGVYFYRLEAGDYRQIRRMMLIK